MDKAVSLIFNQKITSKNSFDIETEFFQSLSSIVRPSNRKEQASNQLKSGANNGQKNEE